MACTWRGTHRIKEQTDGRDKVINKTAGKIKKEGQPVQKPVRDLLSEQLAADATPQLGPRVVVPAEHRSLRLSRQVLLVLVHTAVLLQPLAHRVQVHIGYQNRCHARSLGIPQSGTSNQR